MAAGALALAWKDGHAFPPSRLRRYALSKSSSEVLEMWKGGQDQRVLAQSGSSLCCCLCIFAAHACSQPCTHATRAHTRHSDSCPTHVPQSCSLMHMFIHAHSCSHSCTVDDSNTQIAQCGQVCCGDAGCVKVKTSRGSSWSLAGALRSWKSKSNSGCKRQKQRKVWSAL